MAQENIRIELPNVGETATLRPYITHKIQRRVTSMLIGNQELKQGDDQSEEQMAGRFKREFTLTGDSVIQLEEIVVEGLTISCGNFFASDGTLAEHLEMLPQEDYLILRDKAMSIWNEYQEKTNPKESTAGSQNTSEN